MTQIFGITILILVVYLVFRKWYNRYQEEIFRHKMFKLRDELRLLAIEKKVNKKSREFDYLDFSISKNIQESYFITIFYVFKLEARYRRQDRELNIYKETFERLHSNIIDNEHLKKIFIKKNHIIGEYVFGQMPVMVFLILSIARIISKVANVKALIRKKLSEINYFPELSAIK